MSNLNGLTEPATLFGLQIAADILIATAAGIASTLIFDYSQKKAEGSARSGCVITGSLLAFVSILRFVDIGFYSTGVGAFQVYLNFGAGLIAIVAAGIMIKMHPHSPNLRTAIRLEARNRELETENERLQTERNNALEMSASSVGFLSSISHELRTPLSAVIGMHELLENSDLRPEQRLVASAVSESAKQLLSLVNDIQDLTKIQAGRAKLETKAFELSELLRGAISACADAARRKKLFLNTDLTPGLPKFLLGDPKRVQQVLIHFINNAIKCTDKGGLIVQASLEPSPNANITTIRFSVKDTGSGLTEAEQVNLFLPFTNVDGIRVRRYRDTGLGLYMSKLLVDVMGGTIGVDSKKGQGATFWFTVNLMVTDGIPLQVQPGSPSSPTTTTSVDVPQAIASSSRDGLLALVVEDNPALLQLAISQLQTLGIRCIGAATGQEALQLATQQPFDMILMDCHLDRIDGFEATRSIREAEIEASSKRRVPIIAMTADVLLEDEKRCRESGMDDVLIKPITMEHLRQKLERWIAAAK